MRQAAARRFFRFVKTTFVGGLVFLAPLLLLVVLLVKASGLLKRLAQPLEGVLPIDTFFGLVVADVIALAVIVLLCFAGGLLARVSLANRFIKKAEAGLLWRIPGYGIIKGLTATLDKQGAASAMHPVLVHFDDCAQLAFEVERLPDGRRVIYLPSAPEPRSGTVLLFDADRVEPLPMTFVAAIASLRALGRGVSQALGPTAPRSSS